MHVIRLRGPWQQEPLPGGIVRYSRRFHRPTGLESGERVYLVIGEAAGEIMLNGQLLTDPSRRFDITHVLAAKNLLTLAASEDLSTDSLARLEIGSGRESRTEAQRQREED